MFASRRYMLVLGALCGALAVPQVAHAQGQGHAYGHDKEKHKDKDKDRETVVVSTDDAVVAARDVFGRRGYEVVRVERVEGTRVIYYRRGNMGRGKGKGRLEKMVIRPSGTRVIFEAGPPDEVLVDLRVRLHL